MLATRYCLADCYVANALMEPSGYFVANTVAVYTVTAFDAGLHFRVKAMASVRGDAIESCCCAQIEHALVTHAHTHTRHVPDADMALHTVFQQDTTFSYFE